MKNSILILFLFVVSCTTPSILVTKEQQAGDQLFNSHDYPGAVLHYENCLRASSNLGIYRNIRMEAEISGKIGQSMVMQGNFEQAVSWFRKRIELDSADQNLEGMIRGYTDMGKTRIVQGKYREGISILDKSLELARDFESSPKTVLRLNVAMARLAQAQANVALGRFEEGKKELDKAYLTCMQAGYAPGLAETCLLYATIHTDLGELNAAEAWLTKSVIHCSESGFSVTRQLLLDAEIKALKGLFNKALQAGENALSEAEKTGIVSHQVWANIRNGDLFRQLGDAAAAGTYYKKAGILNAGMENSFALTASHAVRTDSVNNILDYYLREGITTGQGKVWMRLGESELSAGNFSEALLNYSRADSVFIKNGNAEGKSFARLGQARCYLGTNSSEDALGLLDKIIENPSSEELMWQVWYRKGIAHELLGDYENAEQSYRAAIDIIERSRSNIALESLKSSFLNSKIEVYDRLIKLLIEKKKSTEAFMLSERARARSFLDLLGNRQKLTVESGNRSLQLKEQELRDQLDKLQRTLYELAFASEEEARVAEVKRAVMEELSMVQDEYELTMNRLRISDRDYLRQISLDPPDSETIQKLIPENALVLEYWTGPSGCYLWIISNKNIRLEKLKISIDQLEMLILEARRNIQSNNQTRYRTLLSMLYNELIAPASADLGGIIDLCVIPHGKLHLLPFQALINQKGEFMGQSVNILNMPSASIMKEISALSCGGSISLLGMAIGNKAVGAFTSLPGTRQEMEFIAGQFKDPVLAFEDMATESFMKNNLSGKKMIHLATHGVFNEVRPAYSFLLFSPDEQNDGQLMVSEIMNLNTTSCLVTLSACETGISEISKGDELVGLSRAFLASGAKTVAVSLWSVADQPTAKLMVYFYKNLESMVPYKAMAEAQRKLMTEYPEPLYWSAFVVSGGQL